MARRALSVTLGSDNVTWLKGRAGAAGDSVSAVLDRIVSQARRSGGQEPVRSVVGTIDIDSTDALLLDADAAVRSLFEASVQRPLVVREARARFKTRRGTPRKPRG
jgi:hypothetical protein